MLTNQAEEQILVHTLYEVQSTTTKFALRQSGKLNFTFDKKLHCESNFTLNFSSKLHKKLAAEMYADFIKVVEKSRNKKALLV